MRRTALQGFAVLHQRLDRERVLSTRETLVGRLVSHDDGQRHPLLGKLLVNMDHLRGLLDGLLARGVRRMALLPQELSRAQEQTRAHLPAHHVGPLVAEDRQVAVGLNPVLIGVPDDRLRRRTHDQFLLQLGIGIDHDALAVGIVFQAVVRHHGALLGETLDMVGVLMPRILEHPVQRGLHLLPDCIAVGFDDHAPTDGRILSQPGLHDQLVVPLRIVLVGLRKVFQFLCHIFLIFYFYFELQIYEKIKGPSQRQTFNYYVYAFRSGIRASAPRCDG